MELMELIKSRRSIRKYEQKEIDEDILFSMVDCGRLAPSGGNLQPLEYIVVTEAERRSKIFSCLNWAGYISPAGNPPPDFEPMAYIVVLANTEIKEKNFEYDAGAAIENIMLAGFSEGISSCWIRNFKPEEIREVLSIPVQFLPITVIALGYPAENSVVEPVVDDSIRYWKDEEGTFHVPKRSLESILHRDQYNQKN